MIDSRACAKPMLGAAWKPKPSGPRCASGWIIRSSLGRASVETTSGPMKPAIPHMYRFPCP